MKIISFIVNDDEADDIWNLSLEEGSTIWITVMDDNAKEAVEIEVILDQIKDF